MLSLEIEIEKLEGIEKNWKKVNMEWVGAAFVWQQFVLNIFVVLFLFVRLCVPMNGYNGENESKEMDKRRKWQRYGQLNSAAAEQFSSRYELKLNKIQEIILRQLSLLLMATFLFSAEFSIEVVFDIFKP